MRTSVEHNLTYQRLQLWKLEAVLVSDEIVYYDYFIVNVHG